jgi:DNA-binding protein YbaB
VHDDPVERLAELRDRADSVAQKMEVALGAVGGQKGRAQHQADEYTGSDSTGLVTVSMVADGPVREVTVQRGWRERLGITGLSAAVQEAVQSAATARLGAWGEAFVEQDSAPDPRPRPAPLTYETLAAQVDELATGTMSGSQRQAALEELLAMAEEVERGIDQVSAQMQAVLDATYTGRSQSGHVSVTVTGAGAVTEIRYDSRWLGEAHELNIGRETADAFRAAYLRAGERTVADAVANSPLGQIQALSQDPLGLARRLYLRND